MVKQVIGVNGYWKIFVYYNIDYEYFMDIRKSLIDAGADNRTIDSIYDNMLSGRVKAFTFSGLKKHISVVGFNIHVKRNDYLNSIVHEAKHVKQAMLDAYDVNDEGEPPTYTVGYLVMRMYNGFKCPS